MGTLTGSITQPIRTIATRTAPSTTMTMASNIQLIHSTSDLTISTISSMLMPIITTFRANMIFHSTMDSLLSTSNTSWIHITPQLNGSLITVLILMPTLSTTLQSTTIPHTTQTGMVMATLTLITESILTTETMGTGHMLTPSWQSTPSLMQRTRCTCLMRRHISSTESSYYKFTK